MVDDWNEATRGVKNNIFRFSCIHRLPTDDYPIAACSAQRAGRTQTLGNFQTRAAPTRNDNDDDNEEDYDSGDRREATVTVETMQY